MKDYMEFINSKMIKFFEIEDFINDDVYNFTDDVKEIISDLAKVCKDSNTFKASLVSKDFKRLISMDKNELMSEMLTKIAGAPTRIHTNAVVLAYMPYIDADIKGES